MGALLGDKRAQCSAAKSRPINKAPECMALIGFHGSIGQPLIIVQRQITRTCAITMYGAP